MANPSAKSKRITGFERGSAAIGRGQVKEVMRQGRSGPRSLGNTVSAVILAIATVTALTGCIDQGLRPTPTSSNYLPSTDPTSPVDDGEIIAAPEASGDSQRDAITAATKVVQTFAQPQLSADKWWAQMLPLLSQQGGVAYEGTDPSQIPVHRVTGAGTVLPDSTEVSLIVQLPTDADLYNITLTRPAASAPWLADRIRPAQG
jgi:hypothetical protein